MQMLRRFFGLKPEMNIGELWMRMFDHDFVDLDWSPDDEMDERDRRDVSESSMETWQEAFDAIGSGPSTPRPTARMEWKAVEMEVFGLAVAQLCPEHSVLEIVVAKRLLEDLEDGSDIWDAMGHYNKAIGRWSERDRSIRIPYGKHEPSRVPQDCAARLSNRMGIPLDAGAPIDVLAATLVRRLRRKLSTDAHSFLQLIIKGLYQRATHEIEAVRLKHP